MKSAAHQDHPHGFTLEHLDLRCPTPRSSPSTLLHLFFNSGSTLEAVAHTKGISGEALRRKEMMVVMSEVRTVDQKFVPKLYKLWAYAAGVGGYAIPDIQGRIRTMLFLSFVEEPHDRLILLLDLLLFLLSILVDLRPVFPASIQE